MPQREIIIGDVHGCLKELTTLIDRLQVKNDDHLIFVGDLVDKGPDSAPVVWYVHGLQEQGVPVTIVEGNHEETHTRFRRQEKQRRGGAENLIARASEIRKINRRFEREHIKFLENAVLWHRIPHRNILVVHAGIPLGMRELPDPQTWRSLPRGKKRTEAASLLRLRYEDYQGNYIKLGCERESDFFWAERYDGRFGHVFFGHEPFVEERQPQEFPHATGIDTGCVYGGYLTAAVFWPGVEEPKYVSVKAQRAYYKRSLTSASYA